MAVFRTLLTNFGNSRAQELRGRNPIIMFETFMQLAELVIPTQRVYMKTFRDAVLTALVHGTKADTIELMKLQNKVVIEEMPTEYSVANWRIWWTAIARAVSETKFRHVPAISLKPVDIANSRVPFFTIHYEDALVLQGDKTVELLGVSFEAISESDEYFVELSTTASPEVARRIEEEYRNIADWRPDYTAIRDNLMEEFKITKQLDNAVLLID